MTKPSLASAQSARASTAGRIGGRPHRWPAVLAVEVATMVLAARSASLALLPPNLAHHLPVWPACV
jgi:hypothetical protein